MHVIALFIIIFASYTSIGAAAHSKSSSYLNDSLNGSALARSSSSIESFSLGDTERPLTPAEYERLTNAIGDIDKAGIQSVTVNALIDRLTDAYLKDPIAGELLVYIQTMLLHELRLERIRNTLKTQASIPEDIEGLAAVVQDDNELATINTGVVSKLLTDLEKYYGLAPLNHAKEQFANLSDQQLAELIDAAAEGRLADMITPLQFLGIIKGLNTEEPNISDERDHLIDLIVIAAVNNNIKQNPTYNLFTNDQRQNDILQLSEDSLNEYYATSGRKRKTVSTKQPKKSFAQRWFSRRK